MVYSLDFVVRDYECDLQGIVNNANYQHYYEHTRHQFLLENNISFAKLHEETAEELGINIDTIKALLDELKQLLTGISMLKEISKRSRDY